MADREGFGSSDSVQALGAAAQQARSELEQLIDPVNSDVMATVPDLWGGEAATAMRRHWYRFTMASRGLGSPLDTYARWLDVAAKVMTRAREELEAAQQYADRNGLYIQPDLTVRAYLSDRVDAGAQIAIAQSKVNDAKQLADEARTHIRTANRMLEKHAAQSLQEMQEILTAIAGGVGGRGARRPGAQRPGTRRPPRGQTGRNGQDDMLEWGPEGRIRLPRASAGEWVEGPPGPRGVWVPNRPGDYGLLPGQSIRWRDGVPDLSEYKVPPERMPGGGRPGPHRPAVDSQPRDGQ
jgi:hypothetical protein